MTVRERAVALEAAGFTPRQAQFVALAALVGGYCLRRQYQAFASVPAGVQVRSLLDGLVARGWATRQRFRADRAHVYHLSGKPLYRCLDETDNRHRRVVSPARIAQKLMLLDAVLAHPDLEWYATEEDKVTLFRERGIPDTCLPRRRYSPTTGARDRRHTVRYFVEKVPVGYHPRDGRFVVCYLTTDPSARSFERFLNDHAPLLTKLPRWTIQVVFPPPVRTRDAHHRVFDRWYADLPKPLTRDDLDWALKTHGRVQRNDPHVSLDDLHRLQDVVAMVGRETFVVGVIGQGKRPVLPILVSQPFTGAYEEYVVPFRYDGFGHLPGLA